jgi:hypothetical protein
MHRRSPIARIAVPLLLLSILLFNYSQLKDTENVRLIHEVSLFLMGVLFAVLIMNVARLFRKDKPV